MINGNNSRLGWVGLVLLAAACSGSDGKSGTNGTNALMSTTDEPAGSNCTDGGKKLTWGLDANGNGKLDSSEVTGTTYLCNSALAAGAIVSNTVLAVGDTNCPTGGNRVDTGLDANGNGILDASEVKSVYVCNGGAGVIGVSGDAGTPGATGVTGATGDTGATGSTGAKGSTGARGSSSGGTTVIVPAR